MPDRKFLFLRRVSRIPGYIAFAMAVSFTALAAPGPVGESQVDRIDRAVGRYADIQAQGGWPQIPDGPVLGLGASDPRVMVLRSRLAASGDLSGGEGDRIYDADLRDAVRRFQERHGLSADGRVGRETLAALNIPVAQRIAQLELNKTRWESIPEPGSTYVLVNTAAARLDAVEDGHAVLQMLVIVGDRLHPTPDLHSHVAAVVFYPPWNVPASIARREILPKLRRDPGYLAAQDLRIVNRPDDPFGRTVNWRAISAGTFPFQLRQLPGPRNSLGLIKFEIPNEYDVYLHDTPAKSLFQQPKRAFSHGCIRVSRPRELAAWILSAQGWDAEAVDAVIDEGLTRRIPVRRSIPVHVLYLTAFVDPDGTVQFRDDVYGRDREALLARQAEPALATETECRG